MSPQSGRLSQSVRLSDVLGRDKRMTVFSGLIRDIESVSLRLDDPEQKSTVLSPLNSAISELPRKPWEDASEYSALGSDAYEGDAGLDRARANLQRLVQAHILPVQTWREGEKVIPLGQGSPIWWEEMSGKRVIQPDGIVSEVAATATNGEIWLLQGVLGKPNP